MSGNFFHPQAYSAFSPQVLYVTDHRHPKVLGRHEGGGGRL